MELHREGTLSYLSWHALSRLSLCNSFLRKVCRDHVWAVARAEADAWTPTEPREPCADCGDAHDWRWYQPEAEYPVRSKSRSWSACQPLLGNLHFGGSIRVSPLYRAWLYWDWSFFCAWEVLSAASGADEDCPQISDPWRDPSMCQQKKKKLVIDFLVQLVSSRAIFDEQVLRDVLTLLGVLDGGRGGEANPQRRLVAPIEDYPEWMRCAGHHIYHSSLQARCVPMGRAPWNRIFSSMQNATLEACERVAFSALPELGARAFLLDHQRRDARSSLASLRSDIVEKLSEAIFSELHTTLLLRPSEKRKKRRAPSVCAAFVGWAFDIFAGMIAAESMQEYMLASERHVNGEKAMPSACEKLWRPRKTPDLLPSASMLKVLREVMWEHNDEFRERVLVGDAKVRVTRLDVDTISFFGFFEEKYASMASCLRVNEFPAPLPGTKEGDLVLFVEGTLK